MAELVGAISGAITIGALATSVALSIARLKSNWKQLENAPEDVGRLVEEVEILFLILDDIKDDQTKNPISTLLLDGTSLSRSLEHCQKAADKLRLLADDVGNNINMSRHLKRKWASAKVLLKKEKFEKFKLELDATVRLLCLSHQSYTLALLRLQPDIIFARVTQTVVPAATSRSTTLVNQPQNPLILHHLPAVIAPKRYRPMVLSRQHNLEFQSAFNVLGSLTCRTRRFAETDHRELEEFGKPQEIQEMVVWYRGPAWLVNRAWNLYASKAYNGWNFTIRQYNVVPHNSPVFMYALDGDVVGLQRLFDKHEASPLDCYEDGWTPLHIAATYGKHLVCKLLIDLGANPNFQLDGRGYRNYSAIHAALWHSGWMCYPDNNKDALETSRLFLSEADINSWELCRYHGTEEGFSLWQQHLFPHYYETSLQERVETAIEIAFGSPINGSMLVKKALTRDEIPHLAGSLRNTSGRTLLHALGILIGNATWQDFWSGDSQVNNLTGEKYTDELAGWRIILREIIKSGADLHAMTDGNYTPFLYLLLGALKMDGEDDTYSWRSILGVWLGDLASCGVDLYTYGQREQELHDRGLAAWEGWYVGGWVKPDGVLIETRGRLASLAYGKSPGDWSVIVERTVFELDEDFEQMREIPGSWVED